MEPKITKWPVLIEQAALPLTIFTFSLSYVRLCLCCSQGHFKWFGVSQDHRNPNQVERLRCVSQFPCCPHKRQCCKLARNNF